MIQLTIIIYVNTFKKGGDKISKIKNWEKKKETNGITIWRNRYKHELTVEIVSFESQRMDDEDEWNWGYGYPALHRKGIPNSPEVFESKDDAKKWAVNYMRKHPNG